VVCFFGFPIGSIGGGGGGGLQDNMDWIHRNHNRLMWQADAKTVTNHRVPQNEENFLTSSKHVGFSSRSLFHELSCRML
jgi:hypothetical protein